MYRILIADDERIERLILYQVLDRNLRDRCEIFQAENGREALEVFVREKIQIAILDIKMPGIDGIEAARQIRQADPWCSIIFLTAFDEFAYARKAITVRALDYLLKPCDEGELMLVLEEAIRLAGDRERRSRQGEGTAGSGGGAAGAYDTASMPEVTLIYAEVDPLDPIVGQMASDFKSKVEELSDGKITIDVQASGVLGSENDVLDTMMGGGTIDMSRISAFALTSYGGQKSMLLSLPYTFVSREHYWDFANSDLADEYPHDGSRSLPSQRIGKDSGYLGRRGGPGLGHDHDRGGMAVCHRSGSQGELCEHA